MTIKIKGNISDFTIIDLFWRFLYLLPAADAINGILVRQQSTRGVGTIFHAIITVLAICIIIIENIRYNTISKMFIVCVFSIIVSALFTIFFGNNISTISFERIVKFLVTIFLLYTFDFLFKNNRISKDQAVNMMDFQFRSVILITFFADLAGISNHTYTNMGNIGLFAGSNEPNIIFMIAITYFTWKLKNRNSFTEVIFYVLGILCMIMTESKSGVVIAAIYALILFLIILNKIFNIKNRFRNLMLALVTVIGASGVMLRYYKKISSTFLARQTYLQQNLGDVNSASYLSSGRISRINSLIVQPLEQDFSGGFFGILKGLQRLIVGSGISNQYSETMEMDYFDVYLYGGLVWLFAFVALSVYIFKKVIKIQTSKSVIFGLFIVFIASFFVGHAWNGGYSGLYFAMICAFLMNYDSKNRRNENE